MARLANVIFFEELQATAVLASLLVLIATVFIKLLVFKVIVELGIEGNESGLSYKSCCTTET